jgi:hypothetical protein
LLTAAGDGCRAVATCKPISNSFVFRDARQQCVGVTGASFQQCGVWWVVLWHHPRNCLLLAFKHTPPSRSSETTPGLLTLSSQNSHPPRTGTLHTSTAPASLWTQQQGHVLKPAGASGVSGKNTTWGCPSATGMLHCPGCSAFCFALPWRPERPTSRPHT